MNVADGQMESILLISKKHAKQAEDTKILVSIIFKTFLNVSSMHILCAPTTFKFAFKLTQTCEFPQI